MAAPRLLPHARAQQTPAGDVVVPALARLGISIPALSAETHRILGDPSRLTGLMTAIKQRRGGHAPRRRMTQ